MSASEAIPAGVTNDPGAVIARNRGRFKSCYNVALAKDPSASGTIKVDVSLATDGSVADAVVVESEGSSELAECIRKCFTFMRFSPPGEGEQNHFVVPVVLSAKQ